MSANKYKYDGLLIFSLVVAGFHQYVTDDTESWKTFFFLSGWWALIVLLQYAADRGWWNPDKPPYED